MNPNKVWWLLAIITCGYLASIRWFSATTLCIFKNVTGLPCPGCGLTRSAVAFFHLNFQESFRYHPLLLLVVGVVVLFFLSLKRKKYWELLQKKWFWVSVLSVFAATYMIRMLLYFPRTPPMDFESRSLFTCLKVWMNPLLNIWMR
jgi:hypothetical protein